MSNNRGSDGPELEEYFRALRRAVRGVLQGARRLMSFVVIRTLNTTHHLTLGLLEAATRLIDGTFDAVTAAAETVDARIDQAIDGLFD